MRPHAVHPAPSAALAFIADLPALLTKREVAKLLRMSERSVDRYVTRGRLRVIKLHAGAGGSARVLISRDELARFLEQSML